MPLTAPIVSQSASTRSIDRARWLTEVGNALDVAQGLADNLVECGVDSAEVGALASRLGVLRHEVERLRLGRNDDWAEYAPIWTNLQPG